jgi:hypothetical protein
MIALATGLLATGLVCVAFESLGVATPFFGIAVLLFRYA